MIYTAIKLTFFLFRKKQNLLQRVAIVCVLSPFSGDVRSKEHRGLGHGGADVQMNVWVDTMALGGSEQDVKATDSLNTA